MESNIIKSQIIGYKDLSDYVIDKFYDFFDKNISDTDSSPNKIINQLISNLRNELFFLVEFPYVEKYYRDIYYNYFSTKHNSYSRNSIRINIFNREIDYEDFEIGKLEDSNYLGYFTIRPTYPNIIGQSYISPNAFQGFNGIEVATCSKKSFVEGIRFKSKSFPYSNQDGEFMSCAETSLSVILNYFGTKYSTYRAHLPSSILSTIELLTEQRQTPTSGLHFEHISYILNRFGFGTVIYEREEFKNEFNSLISIYIDSKIPLIAGIKSKDDTFNHSVIIAGQEKLEQLDFTKYDLVCKKGNGLQNQFAFLDEFPKRYIVIDDNVPPYRLIELDKPTANIGYPEKKVYSETSIFTFIVPLYKKIYRDATKAKFTIQKLIENPEIGYKFKSEILIRVLLTSSSSFKNYIKKLKGFNKNLESFILQTHMPKFIWLAEIYDKNTFPSSKEAKAIIVTDSTDPIRDLDIEDVLFFACYPDKTIIIDSQYDIQYDIEYDYLNEEISDIEVESDNKVQPENDNIGEVFDENITDIGDIEEKIIYLHEVFKNYSYYSNYK